MRQGPASPPRPPLQHRGQRPAPRTSGLAWRPAPLPSPRSLLLGSRFPAGQRLAPLEGRAKEAKAQLSLLKRIGVVGNPTLQLGRYLGPIMIWEEAGLSHRSSMGGAQRRSKLKTSSLRYHMF